MHRGNTVDRRFPDGDGSAPIELMHGPRIERLEQMRHLQGRHEARSSACGQPADRAGVQMVIVIVAEQYDIDRRQILPPNPRRAQSSRTGPRNGACSLRPDRVRQDVHAVLLQQHRRVIDERDAQLRAFHPGGRSRGNNIVHEAARWFAPARQLPLDYIAETSRLRRFRIEESLAVKVRRKACDGGVSVHAFLLTHRLRGTPVPRLRRTCAVSKTPATR